MVSSASYFGIDVNSEVTSKDIMTSFFDIFTQLISAADLTDVVDSCVRNWTLDATHFSNPKVCEPHEATMGRSGIHGLGVFDNRVSWLKLLVVIGLQFLLKA